MQQVTVRARRNRAGSRISSCCKMAWPHSVYRDNLAEVQRILDDRTRLTISTASQPMRLGSV